MYRYDKLYIMYVPERLLTTFSEIICHPGLVPGSRHYRERSRNKSGMTHYCPG